jgi:hypothetical protein
MINAMDQQALLQERELMRKQRWGRALHKQASRVTVFGH